MLNFSLWDLYGNFCSLLRFQGILVLINNFFGVIATSALGVCNQIQAVASMFVNNLTTAIKPQIFKSYSKGDYERFVDLIYTSIKYSIILTLMVLLPFFLESEFILRLWLGKYPEYAENMSKLILLFMLFSNISLNLATGIHAIGKVKLISIINGTLYLFVPMLTYFFYNYEGSIYIPFVLNIIFILIGGFLNSIYLKVYLGEVFSIKKCYIEVISPLLILAFLVYFSLSFFELFCKQGLVKFLLNTVLCEILIGGYCYVFVLDEKFRNTVKLKLRIL